MINLPDRCRPKGKIDQIAISTLCILTLWISTLRENRPNGIDLLDIHLLDIDLQTLHPLYHSTIRLGYISLCHWVWNHDMWEHLLKFFIRHVFSIPLATKFDPTYLGCETTTTLNTGPSSYPLVCKCFNHCYFWQLTLFNELTY